MKLPQVKIVIKTWTISKTLWTSRDGFSMRLALYILMILTLLLLRCIHTVRLRLHPNRFLGWTLSLLLVFNVNTLKSGIQPLIFFSIAITVEQCKQAFTMLFFLTEVYYANKYIRNNPA